MYDRLLALHIQDAARTYRRPAYYLADPLLRTKRTVLMAMTTSCDGAAPGNVPSARARHGSRSLPYHGGRVLWVLILCWPLGVCLIVAAFVVEFAFRRTVLAVAMFVVGAVVIGWAVRRGLAAAERAHGVRVDVPR